MEILLDTHTWLWAMSKPDRLNARAQNLMVSRSNVIYISVVSCWEIAIKWSNGKLKLEEHPATFIPERLARDAITVLPVSLEHALQVSTLPHHHKDPFGLLLIAQAQVEGLLLMTADDVFSQYEVRLIKAG